MSPLPQDEPPSLAGIGTVAAQALQGLSARLGAKGLVPASVSCLGSPRELMADPSWTAAVVLSPFKRDVCARAKSWVRAHGRREWSTRWFARPTALSV